MLASCVAVVLAFLGYVIAYGAGELRYEKPNDYPGSKYGARIICTVIFGAALLCARYL